MLDSSLTAAALEGIQVKDLMALLGRVRVAQTHESGGPR
jgi:hypothetical protein